VAIVQISRITQRKGLASDLPQPLAGAELGWAIDQRRLFIGNGTIAEGAPVVGNTEVLTEFSDILSFATEYTYQGQAAGYAVQTGPTSSVPISQSLQSRLDSYAVITDFGATGDGITDVTADINRALYQIFCRDNNPAVRRSIFFPAGIYIITDTLLIPPFCRLYGEGADSTIISFNVQPWTSTIAYTSGVLVTDTGLYYRSISEVPIGTVITNTTYWQPETLPEYVFRTADSLQQVGVNIAANGAIAPQSIEISGMKFVTNMVNNGALIEDASNCFFDAVTIEGYGTTSNLITAVDDIAAIRWASTVSFVCSNINWNNCKFSGFTYGTNTDQQINGATISNSVFDTLYQGAVLGSAIPVNGGPTGVRLVQNIFNNIYVQGILFDTVGLNCSAYNTFYDVGNHFQGTTNPSAPVIDINGTNNVSVGDMFQRTTQYSTGLHPRIQLNNLNGVTLGMNVSDITFYQSNVADTTLANQMAVGVYQRTAGITDTLADNVSSARTLFTFDAVYIRAVKVDYTIVRGTAVRTGTYTIVSGTDASGTNLQGSDSGVQNSAPGQTFSVSETSSVVSWKYVTTSTGSAGTIYYSVTKLA
jgi:hypothetical protein